MSCTRIPSPAAVILLAVAAPAPTQPKARPRDPARPAPKLVPVRVEPFAEGADGKGE